MSGFSSEWLSLREPADHRARDRGLLAELAEAFAGQPRLTICDLGCGTGSNVRAMAEAFPPHQLQEWRLYDYDPALLAAARQTLARWADAVAAEGETLALVKKGRAIRLSTHVADLRPGLAGLIDGCDIVTASAFFDLVSPSWIARAADAIAKAGAQFYTVLTYDGDETWQPPHPQESAMLEAFLRHQQTDKGFGPAAGPGAAEVLVRAFEQQGYAIQTADSPWLLAEDDRTLIHELAKGAADAVRELGVFEEADVASWQADRERAAACSIGHKDVVALRKKL
jgi:hypothetical protein